MPSLRSKAPANDADVFQLDAEGSQSVRERLQRTLGAPDKRRKLLKADEVLRNSSGLPALAGRARKSETSTQRERRLVGYTQRIAARNKAIGLRKTKPGRGLLDADARDKQGQELSLAAAEAGSYDLWSAPVAGPSVKAPTTLHKHQLLSSDVVPTAISLPHPGTSYNPTHSAHQALIAEVAKEAVAEEIESSKLRAIRERAESLKKANTRELWQMAEEDVGSGSEDGQVEAREDVVVRKPKPKTAKEKKRRAQNLLRVRTEAEQRQLLKAQRRAIATLPSLVSGLSTSRQAALEAKQLKRDLLKRRLAQSGLSKLPSGKHRVPAAFPTFQLEEDLAEGLRALKTEGSLWNDYKQSMMERGKLEPRSQVHRERHQKGRRTKQVERFDFKRFQ